MAQELTGFGINTPPLLRETYLEYQERYVTFVDGIIRHPGSGDAGRITPGDIPLLGDIASNAIPEIGEDDPLKPNLDRLLLLQSSSRSLLKDIALAEWDDLAMPRGAVENLVRPIALRVGEKIAPVEDSHGIHFEIIDLLGKIMLESNVSAISSQAGNELKKYIFGHQERLQDSNSAAALAQRLLEEHKKRQREALKK